ncbi:MAG: hypothetical protein WKF51_11405 [Geodermatophilaceae bacterium]
MSSPQPAESDVGLRCDAAETSMLSDRRALTESLAVTVRVGGRGVSWNLPIAAPAAHTTGSNRVQATCGGYGTVMKAVLIVLGAIGALVLLVRLVLDAISRYVNPNPPG